MARFPHAAMQDGKTAGRKASAEQPALSVEEVMEAERERLEVSIVQFSASAASAVCAGCWAQLHSHRCKMLSPS